MNIFKSKKVTKKEEPSFWHQNFLVRIGEPHCPRFGEVSAEFPSHLVKLFTRLGIDHFNLTSDVLASDDTVCLNHEECMDLAKLFMGFRESPVSEFRFDVLFDLSKDFDASDRDLQWSILSRYFGQAGTYELNVIDRSKYPNYYGLKDIFKHEIERAPLDVALEIARKYYGEEIYDLSWSNWTYDKVVEPRVANGIPSFTTCTGEHINIALDSDKEKVLVLNSGYADPPPGYNGPGAYWATQEPTVTVLSLKEISAATGHIWQY